MTLDTQSDLNLISRRLLDIIQPSTESVKDLGHEGVLVTTFTEKVKKLSQKISLDWTINGVGSEPQTQHWTAEFFVWPTPNAPFSVVLGKESIREIRLLETRKPLMFRPTGR
jgi:hypothetical protein